jgi:hypothetical protein
MRLPYAQLFHEPDTRAGQVQACAIASALMYGQARASQESVAGMAKLVDARDLKSLGPRLSGFDPRCPHQSSKQRLDVVDGQLDIARRQRFRRVALKELNDASRQV